jgi:hypothetical protein
MAPEDLTIEHGPDVSWHITIYRSGPYNLTFTDISAIFIYFQVHRYIMRGVKWERIIRVLLNDPEGSLTKYRVAKLSGCSIGWTMEYLGRMEREGLIAGTRVEDFKGLVELWAEAAPRPAHRAFNHPRPADLLSRTGMDYALTTYIADDILHHYLFPSRWDLYVRVDDVDRWRTVLAGEGMVGAGNMPAAPRRPRPVQSPEDRRTLGRLGPPGPGRPQAGGGRLRRGIRADVGCPSIQTMRSRSHGVIWERCSHH